MEEEQRREFLDELRKEMGISKDDDDENRPRSPTIQELETPTPVPVPLESGEGGGEEARLNVPATSASDQGSAVKEM